ncbi:MAG: hypothetical protein LBJ84_05830, partial [Oscillospiraceae bacterium]|nr:hypothetical protein [Oscillospiraceae bacterium]
MAYYPIKCPYCLRVHTNETVRFNLREAIVVSTRSVARAQNEAAPGAQDEQADYYSGGDGWLDDDFDSAPQQQSPSARTGKLPTEGLFTLAELISRFGQENVVAEYKQVNALPALTTADFGGDLLQHVTLTYVENGTETVKRVMDRYCDCDAERPKRLNTSSGSVASYVVLLMGSSNSGKTMYLISLFRALTQAGGFPMPPTGTVAKLSIQVLSEGDSETSIESMSDRLFEEGELPKTTIAMTNEPLTLDITVMFQNNVKKKAMLFLRDMPGEYLTNRERDQEIQRIANQFPYFDGFMIMFDPLTFAENVFPAGLNDKEQRRQIDRLRQVILSRVVPMMRDNVISQPTAALITKGDYFFDERYGGALRNKGVVLARHVLPNLQESFDQQYFAKVSAGA